LQRSIAARDLSTYRSLEHANDVTKQVRQTGSYEVGILVIGTGIVVGSLCNHWTSLVATRGCLSIGGVCVPFFLLLLICLETVGILTATIISAIWNTDHAAFLLPHAMYTIGLTVGMAVIVRTLVS